MVLSIFMVSLIVLQFVSASGETLPKVIGHILHARIFSAELSPDVVNASHRQHCVQLQGPRLPVSLVQFQEALDNVIVAMTPPMDWPRCARGGCELIFCVQQWRYKAEISRDNAHVDYVNRVHTDSVSNAQFYTVSDAAEWLTRWYLPRKLEEEEYRIPKLFPPYAIVKYDATSKHQASHMCVRPAASARPVVRTLVRIQHRDPMLNRLQAPAMTILLRRRPLAHASPACYGVDNDACFDARFTCAKCCNMSQGSGGDLECWQRPFATFDSCCKFWRGSCAWHHSDFWGHDTTDTPASSPEQCQSLCQKTLGCDAWTFIPHNWSPMACRVPFVVTLWMRRLCIFRRKGSWIKVVPHRGLVWGPRDCQSPACLSFDQDRSGPYRGHIEDIADEYACSTRCSNIDNCVSFVYFPDDYVGDASDECAIPTPIPSSWSQRCLLKWGGWEDHRAWFLHLGAAPSKLFSTTFSGLALAGPKTCQHMTQRDH